MKRIVVVNQTTCPLCGYGYAPDDSRTCEHCPLQPSCTMTCCPQCGHTTIDEGTSSLARTAKRLFSFLSDRLLGEQHDADPDFPKQRERSIPDLKGNGRRTNLGQAPSGRAALITGISGEMPLNRRQALLSYGIEPGKCVHVLQQIPLTVFRVAQVELALERELAGMIGVELLPDARECPSRRRADVRFQDLN